MCIRDSKLSCLLFVFTIGMLLYGTIKLGWYIDEIATLFIIMTIVSGLVSRFTPSEIADIFIEASKEMMYGALLVGISRSIDVYKRQHYDNPTQPVNILV